MNSASQILDIAERRMRQVGYNAVSYRDIAAEMGIKSASVHYYFPKKEDLGIALVRRYSDNFKANLFQNSNELAAPAEKIKAFVELYHISLKDEKLVCLCAVLGAEAAGLPGPVAQEVSVFFKDNINWLTEQYEALDMRSPDMAAKTTLSLMEGAMIVSAVNDDYHVFDSAAAQVMQSIQQAVRD